MSTIIATLLGAFFFAAAGVVGALLGVTFADNLESLPDGPPAVKAPIPLLILGCAVIGAVITGRTFSSPQLVMLAIVCVALVAIWIVDARRGIVPDAFTIGPIVIVLLLAIFQHTLPYYAYDLLVVIPFAVAAYLSKGRGMGWGDVKLVALGCVTLGLKWAIIASMGACLALVAVHYARRGGKGVPVAFAPYLTAAIGVAIPLAVLH
jgi:prepilin signal peptidase PulO-like enzyme (type II secretory pathway)